MITVSSSSSADLQRFFSIPEEKIAVIPHGVDLRSFRRIDDDESAALLEPLGLPRDFVLFVGNIEPRKNVAELVAAFEDSRLAKAARLVVVGRLAREANRHTRLFAAATNTLYLGPLPRAQIVALMNSCRAFVFPSRYEGFGLPVLEAMACGAPVIASRAAAIAEVAGDAAFYLDSPSRKHISEAALAVLRDPILAARLRSAGYARSAIYSWERAAKQHVDVFRAAVSGDAFEPSLSRAGNGSGTSGSAAACSRLG